MLELKGITVTITDAEGRNRNILDDVSFTLEPNRFFVITGPNGSGKSTLAKVIMGIQPPTSGRIILNGQDITELGVPERARLGIGFAFQQPVRFKGITVRGMLSLAAGKELATDEACRFLSEVGMCANDYLNRELNETLSGGEMKRIEIATLLARKIAISVFDEPEAGIDLWSFQNLISVFKSIKRSHNGAAIIISHQERILDIADTIALLTSGKLSMMGTKDKILPLITSGAPDCSCIKGRIS